jgi:acetyltransferase
MRPDSPVAVLLGGFDYPRPAERAQPETVWFRLPDGLPVSLRPVHPFDRDILLEGLADPAPEGRFRRFIEPLRGLTESQQECLTRLEHGRHFSWVASRHDAAGDERGVGVARYVAGPEPGDSAEVVVVVADNLQGRGIGTLLVHALAAVAAGQGVTELYVDAAEGNPAIQAIFRRLQAQPLNSVPGRSRVAVDLTTSMAVGLERRALTDLARVAAAAAHPSRWRRLD